MVSALRTVNGLAVEILFFLKKMDAKQLRGGILSRELEEGRSLRRRPIQDPPERIFRSRNPKERR